MAGRPFIVTTTNMYYVRDLAGPHHPVFEVIGKPYDLEQIVQATKAAIAGRVPPVKSSRFLRYHLCAGPPGVGVVILEG